MNLITHKKLFLYLLFLSAPLWLYAQKVPVALLPFWGEDEAIIREFGEEVILSVNGMREYSPWPVDMTRLPADVPEGGFPPYICPSPSITGGTAYALTGEVTMDEERGQWHVRLYLWQMEGNRLLFSDEMTAYYRNDFADTLPGMLDWIFSWVPKPTVAASAAPTQTKVIYFAASEPPKWLYAGLRAGGALRIHTAPSWENPDTTYVHNYFQNLTLAAHLNAQLFSFIGLQIEGIVNIDYEPFGTQTSIILPLLARYSYRRGTMVFAIVGGIYWDFPQGEMKTDFLYDPYYPPWGWTGGICFGNRLGEGYLYLDLRWSSELTDTIKVHPGYEGYRRNILNLCLGYEIGFIHKK